MSIGSQIGSFVNFTVVIGTTTGYGTFASPLYILTNGTVAPSSGDGVISTYSNPVLTNSGTVSAPGIAVSFSNGGHVTNSSATAKILGGSDGIFIGTAAGTVTNLGT